MNKKILLEIVGVIALVIAFTLVLSKYYPEQVSIDKIKQIYLDARGYEINVYSMSLNESSPEIYSNIDETYPKSAGGSEVIYSFFDRGEADIAENILNDSYMLPRFDAVEIKKLTWKEDPYNDRYWRFMFYGLQPASHLLYQYRNTKDAEYREELITLLNSFLDEGMDKNHSWDDYHQVAFRTMVLTNVWWKLREDGSLSPELSVRLLKALKLHGDFLLEESHYEPGYNHGINEAAALFLLSVNFPDLPGADKWLEVSKERINWGLTYLVDSDGILIENSAYYHFYALEKYWDIYDYSNKYGIKISDSLKEKIDQMISYGTYVIEPNSDVPLLGASLKRKIGYFGEYKEMAAYNPGLLYVLTHGKKGKAPEKLNVNYPTAGYVIMRSGWEKRDNFVDQTQLIFDVGEYRTKHSHLDALSFNLYGRGIELMPDSGLYSYEYNEITDYLKGTYAHNTVVVDGLDQNAQGDVNSGQFTEGDGFASQSGEHELYPGVSHKRAIALLGKDVVLIVDQLDSKKEHQYEQVFHLFPGANISENGLVVHAQGSSADQSVTITQLLPKDIELKRYSDTKSPVRGICSYNYKETIPCEMVSYKKNASTARFVTLLTIGDNQKIEASLSDNGEVVYVSYGGKNYVVNIKQTELINDTIVVSNNTLPRIESSSILTSLGSEFNIQSTKEGNEVEKIGDTSINLADKNLLFDMRVDNIAGVDNIGLVLSTNNWKGSMKINLMNSYRNEYGGEWLKVSLGKGDKRTVGGAWKEYGDGFDWSKIDHIKFVIESKNGSVSEMVIRNLATIKSQKEGEVIIIFDDGSETIQLAAEVMKKYGFKGNIAVIGERPAQNAKGYLSIEQLKYLQNIQGWNIASHSYYHKNALEKYYPGNLEYFEKELLQEISFLNSNGINSAPNWYIYPNGATNKQVQEIVGKYYKFARTVQNSPEVYPFGDPLRVKTLSIHNEITPENVINAVSDAKKYNLSLFLTFHRICEGYSCADGTGNEYDTIYNAADFEKIIKNISQQGIKVKTLSEFDRDNGVSFNNVEIKRGTASQIILNITEE